MPVFREDPYPAFNFLIEFPFLGADDGEVVAGFTEVSGLEVGQEMIAYRNGNERTLAPRMLPGLVKYTPIVLKRGVIGSAALWDWMKRSVQGKPERADGLIHLLNEAHDEVVMSWRVRGALPSRLAGPSLNATDSRIAVETLELTHQGLELVD